MSSWWNESTVRDEDGNEVAKDSVRENGRGGHEVIRQDRSGRIIDHTDVYGAGETYDRRSGKRR